MTRSTPARSAPLPRLHPLDLGTEEPRAQPAEGREVAARDEHPAGRLASRTARVAGAAEERARLECGLVRARDEDHSAAHDVADRPGEQRVVGAAEHERVDAGV